MTHHDTPSRREFLRGLAGVTGLVAAGSLLGNDRLTAADLLSNVDRAASATDPAVRMTASTSSSTVPSSTVPTSTVPSRQGEIALPVAVLDGGLVCLNNFNGFSNANGACGHNGTDIGENELFAVARPLLACVDGVIERDEFASSGGNMRVLRGDDGRWYRYHHLSAYEEGVEPDDRVTRGQTIGYMGKTGNTQWTHLHFEVWANSAIPRDGVAIDPVALIDFPADVQVDESRACASDLS